MEESIGLESLNLDAVQETPFENVVPEFGTCGGDNMDPPSLAQDEECKDCTCHPKTPTINTASVKLCFKCREKRATIKIKMEPSCNDCF